MAPAAKRLLLVVALSLGLPLVGHANEGFWLFNRVPKAAIKEALGVDLSDAWLQRAQQATVRFPGGTGSFVSPDGLVLTNHHVSLNTLQRLSTPQRDLVAKGYLAATAADEIRAPDLELLALQRIEDVTSRVNDAAAGARTPAEALGARRAAMTDIERETETRTGLEAEVITLYQGAQFHLYAYRKYTDVRLVFAPEFDAAFYGGDPDNFTFPRYCLDMTLWRVYEDGRPLAAAAYLPLSTTGSREGDPVFVTGHPGSTQRLNTVAHLEFLRDEALPLSLDVFGDVHDALTRYAARGAEQKRQASDDIFGVENSLKSWRGQLGGLRDARLMDKKRADEGELRRVVQADPALSTAYGDAWSDIARARADLRGYNTERVFLENALGFETEYFSLARMLVRWAVERDKPDADRLPEYASLRLPQLTRYVTSGAPIYPGVEQAKLTASLDALRRHLGDAHPAVRLVLDGRSPEDRAAELVAGTALGEPAMRKTLFDGGARAIAASADPMIRLAAAVDARSRELRARYEREVLAVERASYAKIAQAVFAARGDSAYPDATFTLRLSYGSVRGYEEDGRSVAPYTDFKGLYVRGDAHGLKPPYRYPDSWAKARGALPLDTPFNFVTTNDIVGGNSGSPVIDRAGQVVGLIFDGNIQSLPGYFVYDPSVNRAVAVDSRAILAALKTVYRADRLVSELARASGGSNR